MRVSFLFFALAALLPVSGVGSTSNVRTASDGRLRVIQAFLKAGYARDYRTAYDYISSRDQRVWSREQYVRRNGSLNGFALTLARHLANNLELSVVSQDTRPDRTRYEIDYRVPTADEISSQLFDWDEQKINSLSKKEQLQLLDKVDALGQSSDAIRMNGRESLQLVGENGRWKLFYDWASANKVKLNVAPPRRPEIDAQLPSREFVVKRSDPFEVSLRITNKGAAPVSVRLVHHVEPRWIEANLEMIACGALLPVTLQPGESQDIAMAYILSSGVGSGQQIELTYELEAEASAVVPVAMRN